MKFHEKTPLVTLWLKSAGTFKMAEIPKFEGIFTNIQANFSRQMKNVTNLNQLHSLILYPKRTQTKYRE